MIKQFQKSSFYFLSGIFIVFQSCCDEIGPFIDLTGASAALIDTNYIDSNIPAPQDKIVLIEEFTGASCNNCPLGHQSVETILSANPGRVAALSIHNDNPQADSIPGYENFRTAEGIQISQLLGGSAAIPTGAVDRKIFPGESQPAVVRSKWSGFVNTQLAEVPPVNIILTVNNFDVSTRKLIVTAKLHFTSTVDSATFLSLALTESNILSPQKQPDNSTDYNYIHNHLFRGMITQALGATTAPITEAGRVVIKQYQYILPAHWNAANCTVVAFVHFKGTTYRVLQAAIAEL